MNLFQTLMFGAATLGAVVLATPAQAHDDRDYHRDHHRHWRDHRDTVVVESAPAYSTVDNSDVTVAFGGHVHHRHHDIHARVIHER